MFHSLKEEKIVQGKARISNCGNKMHEFFVEPDQEKSKITAMMSKFKEQQRKRTYWKSFSNKSIENLVEEAGEPEYIEDTRWHNKKFFEYGKVQIEVDLENNKVQAVYLPPELLSSSL